MPKRVTIVLGVLACLLAAAAAGAAGTDAAAPTAQAFSVKVLVPDASGDVVGAIAAPPQDQVSSQPSFAYPADGTAVTTGEATASVAATAGGPTASAIADVRSLSLFQGEITADDAAASVGATAAAGAATGQLDGSGVQNLVVLGQPVAATPGAQVPLADWGYLTVLEESVSTGPSGTDYEASVVALHVHLSAAHDGLPAGSEIEVGFAEASASALPAVSTTATAPSTAPTATAPPTLPEPPATGDARAPTSRPRAAKPAHKVKKAQPKLKAPEPKRVVPGTLPPLVRRSIPRITPPLTSPGGYVFPVYGVGSDSFIDTFGGFRADVDWHHGDDIFAPLGAPILAVASGTVYSVGWNPIGGNRLWLRDGEGNEFYYAHLSAYSPLAVDNAHVKAGQVLGFVGNTGDARTTPYHLHFEIHPVSLLGLGYDGAVNPTSYLRAWQHLQDVQFSAAAGWAPRSGLGRGVVAPRPGAILLESSDISTASGLEPGSLERAAVAPISSEGSNPLLSADGGPPAAGS